MIIKFSNNPIVRFFGIVYYSYIAVIFFIFFSTMAWFVHDYLGYTEFSLPVVPVTILGGGIAIFLGFRNNSAYDRWWEARKVWGAIVNETRSYGMEVMSLLSTWYNKKDLTHSLIQQYQREMIYRQIAWLNALRLHLRKNNSWDELKPYLTGQEFEALQTVNNKPQMILYYQSLHLKQAHELGMIDEFRHIEMLQIIKLFYTHQGKCERIKNTVFPYYYSYFTRMFLNLFIITLPFALIKDLGWITIPMSSIISFLFYILDKSGKITEDPFEDRAADTPMTTLCKTLEIDLKNQLGDTDVPSMPAPFKTKFGAEFIK